MRGVFLSSYIKPKAFFLEAELRLNSDYDLQSLHPETEASAVQPNTGEHLKRGLNVQRRKRGGPEPLEVTCTLTKLKNKLLRPAGGALTAQIAANQQCLRRRTTRRIP